MNCWDGQTGAKSSCSSCRAKSSSRRRHLKGRYVKEAGRVFELRLWKVSHGKPSPTVFRSGTCTAIAIFLSPFRNHDRIPPTCTSHPMALEEVLVFIFLANPVFLVAVPETMMRRRSSTLLCCVQRRKK